MSVSLNIHGNSIKDRPRLLRFLADTKPRAVLVMDSFDLAQQIKAQNPATIVIYRTWPDDSIHTQLSPEAWVNRKIAEIGNADVWAYTTNEPGFSDVVLNWTSEVIELAAAKGLKVVVGNFSSGTPTLEDWKRPTARRMLEALDKHRATAICGLHEYACGVITSGFIGGEPGFIQRDTWPKNLTDVTQWHCGRFQFLLEACDFMAIRAPRLIITEHGFDDMSDIAMWTRGLVKTPPFENVRGWKTLWNQWRVWWNCNPEKAYADQLIYADKTIYAHTPVEAQLIFSWGASSEQWQQFNVEDASELQALLVDYAKPAVVTPTPPPAPARLYEPGKDYVYSGKNSFNIRVSYDTSADVKAQLKKGGGVRFYDVDAESADNHVWQKAIVNQKDEGWIAVDIIPLTVAPAPPAPVLTMEALRERDAIDQALADAIAKNQADLANWKIKWYPKITLLNAA